MNRICQIALLSIFLMIYSCSSKQEENSIVFQIKFVDLEDETVIRVDKTNFENYFRNYNLAQLSDSTILILYKYVTTDTSLLCDISPDVRWIIECTDKNYDVMFVGNNSIQINQTIVCNDAIIDSLLQIISSNLDTQLESY